MAPGGHFLLTEGWDPPPRISGGKGEYARQAPQQYHLRFTVKSFGSSVASWAAQTPTLAKINLGVVLSPGHANLRPPEVVSRCGTGVEAAQVGDDLVMINQAARMEFGDHASEALAMLIVAGHRYEVTDAGVARIE